VAVTVDLAVEQVRTDTTDPQTWSHGGAASGVKGILVAAMHNVSDTDHVSAVSYGGSALTRIVRHVDSATEPGAAEWWFLGESVPQGTQTVSAACTTTTDDFHFVSITLLAAGDLEIVDFDGISGNTTNPSVTLNYGGRSCMAFGALFTGIDNGVAEFAENANCTAVHNANIGGGSQQTYVIRQTTAGTSDFAVGGTLSADDAAYAALAVAEVVVESSFDPMGMMGFFGA
jgi:hypothetical protein